LFIILIFFGWYAGAGNLFHLLRKSLLKTKTVFAVTVAVSLRITTCSDTYQNRYGEGTGF
jgi:hypothetical protein